MPMMDVPGLEPYSPFWRMRTELAAIAERKGRKFDVLSDYMDRILGFDIEYRPDYTETVLLRVGNARYKSFRLNSGHNLYKLLIKERRTLESYPFTPKAFVQAIWDALNEARKQGLEDQYGSVRVYELHKLIRKSRGPSYRLAQFAYDLARFSMSSNWIHGNWKLVNYTPPGMKGGILGHPSGKKTLVLPVLKSGMQSTHVFMLGMKKVRKYK